MSGGANKPVNAPTGPAPSERVVYFVGNLASARTKSVSLCRTADEFFHLSKGGAVALMQRRVEPGVFEYIAIGLRKKS